MAETIAQQKEIERISTVVEKFRYKATKAAFAQSKLKQLKRMEKVEAPEEYDNRTFKASLRSETRSAKEVLKVNSLKIGFDKVLSEVDFEVLRGERIGIIGGNGLGKSTLLKTLVGKIPQLEGTFTFGANVKIGYFDQQMAQYRGNESVLENFQKDYPDLTDFEARSALGAFLFSGDDVFKSVGKLSGGEKVRLALCKILHLSPNVLILDEPTNHMDVISKEALENMLVAFDGTLIFVSHDRYFVKKLAQKLLCFENGGAYWYEYGFEQYLEHKENAASQLPKNKPIQKTAKKTFTTPGKEKAKKERQIAKLEEKIATLEAETEDLKNQLGAEENLADYVKLQEITDKIQEKEEELLDLMAQWDELT